MTEQAVVRFARRQDVSTILQLIQELADYEKEGDSVEATEEKLLRTVAFAPADGEATDTAAPTEPTTPDRPARCLLLIAPGGEMAGLALYYYTYSTWRARSGIHLEDLFVRPAHRQQGYGRRLIETLAREVVAMDGGRLEWGVLRWNSPSIRFYEGLGARTRDEFAMMRVDGADLITLAGKK